MRRIVLLIVMVLGVGVLAPTVKARRQTGHPTFDATGFQVNRHYFSQLPLENIDTMSGNVLLQFTDLVLPGNGGLDIRIVRSYNSKNNAWRFGLDGVPYHMDNPNGVGLRFGERARQLGDADARAIVAGLQ